MLRPFIPVQACQRNTVGEARLFRDTDRSGSCAALWLFELSHERCSGEQSRNYKSGYHQVAALHFGDGRAGRKRAHPAGAELGFFLERQVVQLAADTDAKGGLEEHQDNTRQTDAQPHRTSHVQAIDKNHDGGSHHQAQGPGKTLLRSADILGLLVTYHEATQHQAWRIAWIDQHPNREIDEEGQHHQAHEGEVTQLERLKEADHGGEKQDTRPGAYFTLIEYGDSILRHCLTKLKYFCHYQALQSCCVAPIPALPGKAISDIVTVCIRHDPRQRRHPYSRLAWSGLS